MIVFEVPNNMMTGSQMRKERQEFDSILLTYNQRLDRQKKLASGGVRSRNYQVYTSSDKINLTSEPSKESKKSRFTITKKDENSSAIDEPYQDSKECVQLEKPQVTKMTRAKMETEDWQPDRLLLLRFGLQDASKHSKKLWLKKDPLPFAE